MRGPVENLPTPQPLADGLPDAFLTDGFTRDIVSAFDDVLAPVHATLDELDAYFDPRYAPEDFLRWMAGWLGFPIDERWPAERLRAHLVDAVEALRWTGTVRGVAAAVRAYTGSEPEVIDNGGVTGSRRPLGSLPGRSRPLLVVKVPESPGVDRQVVDRLVATIKPAHVPHQVEFIPAR